MRSRGLQDGGVVDPPQAVLVAETGGGMFRSEIAKSGTIRTGLAPTNSSM